jgi:hypothetical protein
MSGIELVQLPDGREIWARVSGMPGPEDIGLGERARALAADTIDQLISSVAGNMRDALDSYDADEVGADFGIELSLQTGRVIGVLAETSATANITVHLTWKRPGATPAAEG